jgi:glycosyltransferase involved in cell wall biosynthesis
MSPGAAPRVSVIVPTYNRRELLAHTLASLGAQDLPRDAYEVLVCDDGSSDGTAEAVTAFQDAVPLRYFYHPDEGFRAAKTRNVGIRNAAGEICVFIDAGIVAHPGFLRAHLASHDRHGGGSDAGGVAVVGYNYAFDPTRTDNAPVTAALDPLDPVGSIRTCRERGWLDIREVFYAKYGDDFSAEPAPWLIYWSGNASARTADLRAVGMFDEEFRSWGGEDTDLGYRLHLANVRFVLNREAAVVDIPHATPSFTEDMAEQAPNLRYMARKYRTPVMDLVAGTPPERFFDLNAMIREQGLPRCAEVLAARGARTAPGFTRTGASASHPAGPRPDNGG